VKHGPSTKTRLSEPDLIAVPAVLNQYVFEIGFFLRRTARGMLLDAPKHGHGALHTLRQATP
jgi:hypothetical protein